MAMSPSGRFSWQASAAGKTADSRSSARMRWMGGGTFFPVAKAQQGQRAAGVPTPTRGEKRRCKNGLLEDASQGIGVEKMKDVGERETVLLAQRNIQPIVSGGGLQLEIERAAKSLAQSQAPSFVDAAAKRGVDD